MIYNRPETTRLVFEAIRQAKPSRLYVAADGARPDWPEDKDRCHQTRDVIKGIDWPCEVHLLFRDRNLGCKEAVSSAISWFFENEEMGIILEDDCLPDPTFFPFCRELLMKYKNEPKVMMVAGTNYLYGKEAPTSYFFSDYYSVWGWATWRRAWSFYDKDMQAWPQSQDVIDGKFKSGKAAAFMKRSLRAVYAGVIKNTWAYPWAFTCMLHGGLSATSGKNVISNIGINGTHGFNKRNYRLMNMPREPLTFPLQHPSKVEVDMDIDDIMLKTLMWCSKPTLNDHIYRTYKKVIGGLHF